MDRTYDTRDFTAYAAMRRELAIDPQRPRYHFVPAANWMNDPNGCIQWQGVYHLFYQHNVRGPLSVDIHWGHAASSDLVHWEDWPIALAPTPDGPDADGCWSGCAVDDDGTPVLVYSGNRVVNGTREQRTCIARSHDGLRTWEKESTNPVIPDLPPGLDLVQYRDPSAWREGDWWYQVTGSGIVGVGGTALLYRSRDLVRWEYLHPLCMGDVNQHESLWTGPMWECPQFFPLGDKHVLLISAWDYGTLFVAHFVGTYRDLRFTPESVARTDLGDSFYAPQTLRDDQGRRIMWGWLRERRSRAEQAASAWNGAMSLPRLVTLRADHTLGYAPAPELEQLRGTPIHIAHLPIAAGEHPLRDVQEDCLELRATFVPGDARAFGFVVRRSPDSVEHTRIVYTPGTGQLTVDRTHSRTIASPDDAVSGGAVPLAPGEPLHLRVFLDRSVLEIFANERVCLTERIYPSRADSLGIACFADGGDAVLESLDAWPMGSIWPE